MRTTESTRCARTQEGGGEGVHRPRHLRAGSGEAELPRGAGSAAGRDLRGRRQDRRARLPPAGVEGVRRTPRRAGTGSVRDRCPDARRRGPVQGGERPAGRQSRQGRAEAAALARDDRAPPRPGHRLRGEGPQPMIVATIRESLHSWLSWVERWVSAATLIDWILIGCGVAALFVAWRLFEAPVRLGSIEVSASDT